MANDPEDGRADRARLQRPVVPVLHVGADPRPDAGRDGRAGQAVGLPGRPHVLQPRRLRPVLQARRASAVHEVIA
ncbi:conserved hypothetical protein [Ricinus communis]|uniref:Uncharacterized protein n=1 Tax=Ricinus communis TaxID=3988 RepID=B9TGT2_RICCO|nr:conserved hypothetical protein [Ricinus communis]